MELNINSLKSNKFFGDIVIILISIVGIILSLVWQGIDLSLLSVSFIGGKYDTMLNSWSLYQSLENLLTWPVDLGYAPIFYGDPSPLFSTIAPYGIALFCLPFYLLFNKNLYLTYNLYFILTYILTAWIGYNFVKYLVKPKLWISIFAGLLLGFAQFRFMHFPHIETLSTQFLIAALYFFHKFIDSNKLGWGILTSISIFFTFTSSGYLGMISLVMMLIIFLSKIFFTRNVFSKKQFINGVSSILFLGIIIYPFFVGRLDNLPGFIETGVYNYANGVNPLDWLSGNSQFFYRIIKPSIGKNTLFIGFVTIIFSIFGLIRSFSHKKNIPDEKNFSIEEIIKTYFLISIVGYVFTLGTSIVINEIEIILPYSYIHMLPGFSALRAANRFIFLPIIGLTVCMAYGINKLISILNPRTKNITIFIILFVGLIDIIPFSGVDREILFDIFDSNRPTRMQNLFIDEVNPIYDWLAKLPEGTAHFNYPVRLSGEFLGRKNSTTANRNYMAGLPFHNNPMLNGWGSINPKWFSIINRDNFPSKEIHQILLDRKINYILVHNDLLAQNEQLELDDRWKNCTIFCQNYIFLERVGEVDIYEIISNE